MSDIKHLLSQITETTSAATLAELNAKIYAQLPKPAVAPKPVIKPTIDKSELISTRPWLKLFFGMIEHTLESVVECPTAESLAAMQKQIRAEKDAVKRANLQQIYTRQEENLRHQKHNAEFIRNLPALCTNWDVDSHVVRKVQKMLMKLTGDLIMEAPQDKLGMPVEEIVWLRSATIKLRERRLSMLPNYWQLELELEAA